MSPDDRAWRKEVYDSLVAMPRSPGDRFHTFWSRAARIEQGQDITASVERGVQYLKDIADADGDQLS
jgi:hypothetical protein